jgi:hypothetical protein
VGLVTSSWEIDFFGRVASLKEAALAQYLATEEGRKATQISLIAAVANGYLSLVADRELIGITEETLASRIESEKLAQLRYDNGVASELDLRQAQSLTEGSRATLAQQRRLLAQDRNALALLVGQPRGDLPGILQNTLLRDAKLMATLPADLPSNVLLNRPDIRQAEQLLIANNANIGAARAAFFPNIGVSRWRRSWSCRSLTLAATKPTLSRPTRPVALPKPNTKKPFKRLSVKWPTHSPARQPWANNCVRCRRKPWLKKRASTCRIYATKMVLPVTSICWWRNVRCL